MPTYSLIVSSSREFAIEPFAIIEQPAKEIVVELHKKVQLNGYKSLQKIFPKMMYGVAIRQLSSDFNIGQNYSARNWKPVPIEDFLNSATFQTYIRGLLPPIQLHTQTLPRYVQSIQSHCDVTNSTQNLFLVKKPTPEQTRQKQDFLELASLCMASPIDEADIRRLL